MQIKIRHSESGFTLIEALIAMVILSIGIFALYSMQLNAVRGNVKADRLTAAATWNMDRLEQLIGTQYAAITNGTSTSADGRYTTTWTVSVDDPSSGLKTVTVTVQDNKGFLSNQVVYTYIKADI